MPKDTVLSFLSFPFVSFSFLFPPAGTWSGCFCTTIFRIFIRQCDSLAGNAAVLFAIRLWV